MQIITKSQFYKLTSQRTNPITRALDELKVGKSMIVKKKDYSGQAPFSKLVTSTFSKKWTDKNFKTKQLDDGTGWTVLRIK